jgi:hypothetical protein
MRQTISGLVAAIAVVAASAAPAMACGGEGLFQGGCSPCGQAYVSPCAQPYVPPPVSSCNSGCGGWGYERLPDPVQQYYQAEPAHQYYYADQGPTYTGPGEFAPYPTYREGGVSGWHAYRHHPSYYGYRAYPHFHHSLYRGEERQSLRYGYVPQRGPRYGGREPGYYGPHEHMRRYY